MLYRGCARRIAYRVCPFGLIENRFNKIGQSFGRKEIDRQSVDAALKHFEYRRGLGTYDEATARHGFDE